MTPDPRARQHRMNIDTPLSESGCRHWSSTGVDASVGEDKVWRCDGCGWLHRFVRQVDGTYRMVDA